MACSTVEGRDVMISDSEAVESLFENSRTLVALYDATDTLRKSNKAFREAYGAVEGELVTWADLVRRNFQNRSGVVLAVEDFERWLASAKSRRGKSAYRAYETDLTDGRWLWMTETVSPSGWMLCIASDITELRTDERVLRQDRDAARKASHTDELTGISNRRHSMAVLEEIIESVARAGRGVACVALLDIDRFKQINDFHGHAFGDEVLVDFAKTIQRNIRMADCFGRVGGEEFLLVLPQLGALAAETFIERLLRQVGRPGCIPGEPNFQYSFSAGFTQVRPGDTAACVYKRADAALYEAKEGGRSRLMSA